MRTKSVSSSPLSLLMDHSMRVGGVPSRMHCVRYLLLLTVDIASLDSEVDAMLLMMMRRVLAQVIRTR